ncbi:MAG: isocitrate lyase/phosphoenolpyruvate mutase family protein [Vicinamibacteria bacterium]
MTNDRAARFRALHGGPEVLVLPNAWDVLTARAFAGAGFPAVGTTSFGIAQAHGLRDGANDAWDATLATVARMSSALDVPLSVDMEGGFGGAPDDVARRARALADAGAAGLNLEDGRHGGTLEDAGRQRDLIAAVRSAVPDAFVNARCDVFWLAPDAGGPGLRTALTRARAYVDAGADGIFLPGLVAPDAIAEAARALGVPLNVLATPRTPTVGVLRDLGVRRLSTGSGPARAVLGLMRRIAHELRAEGTYGYLADAPDYAEANR